MKIMLIERKVKIIWFESFTLQRIMCLISNHIICIWHTLYSIIYIGKYLPLTRVVRKILLTKPQMDTLSHTCTIESEKNTLHRKRSLNELPSVWTMSIGQIKIFASICQIFPHLLTPICTMGSVKGSLVLLSNGWSFNKKRKIEFYRVIG